MRMDKSKVIIGSIFLIGIFLRFIVLNVNTCYVHDDAALAMNIVNKSYIELFNGLEYCQVAPPLFLIFSKFIYSITSKDYQIIDYSLKFIPFLSAIVSIPLFYIFSKLIIKEKIKLYIANILFALNPLLISLSGRFKQYSSEVVIAILLYIIFYKYLSNNKWKMFWYFIIFIAPWISLSSLIILFSGIIIFFLNRQIDKSILFILSSIILFILIYLPNNIQVNYASMNNFWSQYGFISIIHPLRFFIRLGEIFLHGYKFVETILGFFILYKIYEYIRYNKQCSNLIFIGLPIIITLILSNLHLYPFVDRLIAFLVPIFIIILSEYINTTFSKILSASFIMVSLVSLSILFFEISKLPNYRDMPIQYLNDSKIHGAYKPFYTVYKWYTHLD